MFSFIENWAAWLQNTAIATAVGSAARLFPICETIHVMGLSLLIGTIAIVDLRLMGLASMKRSVTDVTRQMLPLTWTGFGIAVVSGSLMFSSNATHYLDVVYFRLKFLVLALAGLNMLVFHLVTWKSVAQWDRASRLPFVVRASGAMSLACWIVVVFFGRWVGFAVG